MHPDYKIRQIQESDNKALAAIIRSTLKEFGANKPGTVYFDPTTDNLSEVFSEPRSVYFVVEKSSSIFGGAGIYPTEGLPEGICELVKIYLDAEVRGKGIGKELMNRCIEEARKLGYSKIYLETMPELTIAIPMYETFGFRFIPGALGNSGHTGCTIFMMKEI